MRIIAYWCLLLVLCAVLPAFPQEPTPGPSGEVSPTPEEPAGDDENLELSETPEEAAGEDENQETPETLFEKTISRDIETATYYELAAWCRDLGLDDTGSAETLRQRIYEHYGAEKSVDTSANASVVIRIESAENVDYFTIEEVDEGYIVMKGRVKLSINEKNTDTIHEIVSDTLIINQSTETMTAQGNVEYNKKSGTDSAFEKFKGESLSFNIKDWSGVFIEGVTQKQESTGENEEVTFYIQGDEIYRSKENVIVLDEGLITSCDEEDPHYSINAEKIWILGPNEWGISNAVLSIGRVPVFYIPFFYNPGDDIFFNPVAGGRDREGVFLMTTTYFIGEKEDEETSLSFMQIAENQQSGLYKKELYGMFLRTTDQKKEDAIPESWYAKFLLDYYSKLGFYGGFQANVPGWGGFSVLNTDIGLARTRTIDSNNSIYFYEEPDGIIEQWNDSSLFGIILPFRYKFDVHATRGAWKFDFAYYSDSYFDRDFSNRQETFNYINEFLLGETAETEPGSVKSSLLWNIYGSYKPAFDLFKPFLSSVSFNTIQASVTWNSKLDESKLVFEPSYRFYYPESLKYPELGMILNGTILNWSSNPTQQEQAATADGPDYSSQINPPWPQDEEEDNENAGEEPSEKNEGSELVLPEYLENKNVKQNRDMVSSFGITYSVVPRINLTSTTNHSIWEEQTDISPDIAYSTFSFWNTVNLKSTGKLFDSLLTFDNTTILNTNYRNKFHRTTNTESVSDTKWEAQLRDAYKFRYINGETKFTLRLHPLQTVKALSASYISYDLDYTFYRREFDDNTTNPLQPEYNEYMFEWDDDKVDRNFTKTFFKYSDVFDYTFEVSTSIPPETVEPQGRTTIKYPLGITATSITADMRLKDFNDIPDVSTPDFGDVWVYELVLSSGFQITTDHVTSTISAGFKKPYGNDWEYDDITYNGQIILNKNVFLTEALIFDINEMSFNSSTTSLSIYSFSFDFNARETNLYEFHLSAGSDGDTSWQKGWNKLDETAFLPYSLNLKFNQKFDTLRLWKNRITMDTTINTNWNMNLQQITNNNLSFTLGFTFSIYEFLQLNISSTSSNQFMYRYIPGLSQQIRPDWEWINPLVDLAKSFNFFNPEDRFESNFKIKSLDIGLTHILHDWFITASYKGRFKLKTNSGTSLLEYVWTPEISFYVQWYALPELKSDVKLDEEGEVEIINK